MKILNASKTQRRWLVYGRFTKARGGEVIQEWRGHGRTLTIAMRHAVLDIMERAAVKRLRHDVVAFTIQPLRAEKRTA